MLCSEDVNSCAMPKPDSSLAFIIMIKTHVDRHLSHKTLCCLEIYACAATVAPDLEECRPNRFVILCFVDKVTIASMMCRTFP